MAFSVLTPNITANTTKDAIISLLLEEHTLNAKEIFSRINKAKPVTYQAVFKDLQQLCKENVLLKSSSRYEINPA